MVTSQKRFGSNFKITLHKPTGNAKNYCIHFIQVIYQTPNVAPDQTLVHDPCTLLLARRRRREAKMEEDTRTEGGGESLCARMRAGSQLVMWRQSHTRWAPPTQWSQRVISFLMLRVAMTGKWLSPFSMLLTASSQRLSGWILPSFFVSSPSASVSVFTSSSSSWLY